ncbi:MAG: cation-translocating P-type ATPase [Elusimicrobiota bacterium]
MINKLYIKIYGMSCVSCSKTIENYLKEKKGILEININFTIQKGYVVYDDELINRFEIISLINSLGYDAKIEIDENFEKIKIKRFKIKLFLTILFAILLFPFSMGHHIGIHLPVFLHHNKHWLEFIFTTLIVTLGYNFFQSGIINSIKTKTLNMDTLISVGVISSYSYSLLMLIEKKYDLLFFETAAYIITFVSIGKFLEQKYRNSATSMLESIFRLKPRKATIVKGEKQIIVDTDTIKEGDIIVVKAGEKIPVDVVVVEGGGTCDESFITGEAIGVEKVKGDEVKAGAINLSGYMKIRAICSGTNSFLDSIIKTLENTHSKKLKIQNLADKVSAYFIPSVMIVAFMSFVYWYLSGMGFRFSFEIFISVLIVSCPCALGLSVPVAISVALARFARESILIKNPGVIDLINNVDTVIFDKTGTLTKSKLFVSKIYSIISEEEFLRIIASIEKYSNHPVAKAIRLKVEENKSILYEAVEFKNFEGRGVVAKIGSKRYFAGNKRFMMENKIKFDDKVIVKIENLQNEFKTIVYLADEEKTLGFVVVEDEIRENAKEVIEYFKKTGKDVIMISGDNKQHCKFIAENLGINQYYCEVLPQEKMKKINELKSKGKVVCMIGDGINDAPALKESDIAISFKSATDIAFETADIILLNDRIIDIVKIFEFLKYLNRKVKQNLLWAFLYNATLIPVACGLFYKSMGIIVKPYFASLAMSLSSITVILNSFSILKKK